MRINMEHVLHLVHAAGVSAYLEHTGGGVWTIYAGPKREEPEWGPRRAAIAGPGWCHLGEFQADTEDFYVGPDDDGATGDDVYWTALLGANTEQLVADLIVAQAKLDDPTRALTIDEINALGLDGTAQGRR